MTKVKLPHDVGVQFDEALAVAHNDFDVAMIRVIDVYDENRLPALSEWWDTADNQNATKKLLDAFENGWEDEKPETFRVPVPFTHGNSIYIHTVNNAGGERPLGVTNINDQHENSEFTMDQINHFGLADLPRYEVDNAQ